MIRRRTPKPEPLPWKYDWRNPDCVIVTRLMVEQGFNSGRFVLTPTEVEDWDMQEIAQESMRHSPNPTYDRDPSYNWRRPGRPSRYTPRSTPRRTR